MKLFVVTLVLISAVAVLAEDDDADWLQFKLKFGKMFLSKGKEEKRKQAFKGNKKVHDELKAAHEAGKIAFEPAIYAFHDLEPEEMLARMTGLEVMGDDSSEEKESPKVPETRQYARNYDSKKYLGAVRNQRSCGSCWTFSTISAIEAGYTIAYAKSIDLSEQHLVDCAKRDYYDNILDGCKGGWMPSAFNWLAKNGGAVEEYNYPYYAVFGQCQTGKSTAVRVAGYKKIGTDEASLKDAIVSYGSLAVAVDAGQWSYYGKGIFTASTVGKITHAVNLVGWGYDDNLQQSYWLLRNSWGPNWGEDGYIRVSTGNLGSYYPEYTYAVVLEY